MGALKFLHLSDIHFSHRTVDTQYDLDRVLRSKLELALTQHIETNGGLSGLLISGDIAYAGAQADYEIADEWITQICRIININPLQTFIVPGNHDVDRSAVQDGSIMDICHRSLRACQINEIDSKVRGFIQRDKEAIFAPLQNFNQFAAKYSCLSSAATDLTWTDNQSFRFDDNTKLALHGVNTALISDANDHADNGKLVCSSFQTSIVPAADEIYMTLSHHPPEWIRDGEILRRNLNDFAAIQLFGHKHEPAQYIIDNKSLVVAAGAVHPERNEPQWLPSFNILELDIEGVGAHRRLAVKSFKYRWDNEDRAFSAKHYLGQPFRKNLLEITAQPAYSEPTGTQNQNAVATEDEHRSLADVNPQRYLTYRYLLLGLAIKVKIAAELGLLSDKDLPLSEASFNKIVERAKDAAKLKNLWDAVAHNDNQMQNIANPF